MRTTLSRSRAAAIHLGISASIAILVFVAIYFLWYPGPLFDSAGGRDLFLVVLAVDVTIGPMVTLLVFKPGKKGLLFDLWVIGIAQTAFLAYGIWAIAESRPVYIAFVKDRFELARANQIPNSVLDEARMNRYIDLPLAGPRVVGVRFPTDPDERFKIMLSGMGGVDIHAYPHYHVPYDAVRKDVVAKGQPLARLTQFNKSLSITELAASVGRSESQVRFLPLRAGKVDLTVLVDARDGSILKITTLKPWEYE